MMLLDTRYEANNQHIAQSRLTAIPVIIRDENLSATPGAVPSAVHDWFTAEERRGERPQRYLQAMAEDIEANGRYLHTHTHDFFLHRHICEVADQWSFTDLVSHTAGSRELMALQHGQDIPDLLHSLSQPVRQIDAELARPYYAFDNGTVESKAYCYQGRLAFVHRLFSDIGTKTAHTLVIEQL